MSIARVQGFTSLEETKSTASAATIARAFTSNVTAGNMIVAIVRSKSDAGPSADVQSITDGIGNTYTKAVGSTPIASSERVEIYYAKNIAGGACTVTATWAAAVQRRAINVFEVSGCDTTAPNEATNSGAGTSTTPSAGNVTTAGEAIIFAAGVNDNTYIALNSGTGWTSRAAGDFWGQATYEDRLEAASGTFTGDFSQASSIEWVAIIAAFKVAGGGTQSFSYTASGGLTFAGTAAQLRTAARVAAGGLTFGGTAAQARVAARLASGGIVFGGSAAVATHESTRTVQAAGGIVFGGASGLSTVGGAGSIAQGNVFKGFLVNIGRFLGR